MVDNHGGNDLLDTTDCLEAVGVFKGWKNFLFLIVLLCLVLLQLSFHLADRGYIKIEGQLYGNEPAVGPNAPAEPGTSTIDSGPVEPAEPVEIDEPAEPSEPEEPGESAEPNEPAEPNELGRSSSALQWTEPRIRSTAPKTQYASQWIPKEYLSKITFKQLTWVIRFVNAVLILSTTLYCLTLLFSLKVSMNGRLGGINHITRAFFLSLLMLVLLLPWQKVFGSVITGVIFTPEELVKWYSSKTEDILDMTLYYLRFSGYGVLMLFLLILSQLRGIRWAKAILRRLEII
ncbi:MAG: hypothetical protein AMJ65_06435 [Phycisphaerae bacterium SG8_4]|nr:MAG: hypothetical protein AMJ65_06435 [Phycisphaerae bacterium SG8_4]